MCGDSVEMYEDSVVMFGDVCGDGVEIVWRHIWRWCGAVCGHRVGVVSSSGF